MPQKWNRYQVIFLCIYLRFLLDVEYTPHDLNKLRGDLAGLLDALKVHLQESVEDLINREIKASIAFADWRYEMEEETMGIS